LEAADEFEIADNVRKQNLDTGNEKHHEFPVTVRNGKT
jgi:hypothetical protein